MKVKNKKSIVLILLIITSLIMINISYYPGSDTNSDSIQDIVSVSDSLFPDPEQANSNNNGTNNKTDINWTKHEEGGSNLKLEPIRDYGYPGKKIKISIDFYNNETQKITVKLNFYYYPADSDISNSVLFQNLTIEADSKTTAIGSIKWNISTDAIRKGENSTSYIVWCKVSEPLDLGYSTNEIKIKMIEKPDTSKTPVYLQIWFIVGFVSLIIFFLTIILSLIGKIPQDRLPIQPALVVMALVIMIIAMIGNILDPAVHVIGPQDIAGMVIIHPITALTAGFLVAGGLEASGAFAAAADALGRIEKLKFKGRTLFGFTGTVVILTNIPTLIAMPCGRILGAALMPAAWFFGYRIAKQVGDARMVGVVVFPFIVNAAASCGPSPLGGIGTIGEGLSKMPIGSFTTAQSTGIMICTGVCALFMRFLTPMRPADLSDEDIKRELEAEKAAKVAVAGPDSNSKKTEQGSTKEGSEPKTAVPVAKPVEEKSKPPPLARKVE